jgi:hypothetical protein
MTNSKRYKTAAANVKNKRIFEFKELERLIPRDLLAIDLGITQARMDQLMGDGIGKMKLEEMLKTAELLKLDSAYVFDIVANQFLKDKNRGIEVIIL